MSHKFWKPVLATTAIIFLLSSWGCGQKIKSSVKTNDTQHGLVASEAQIVMLPFADYTAGKRPDDSLRRQVKIQSALAHHLASAGYYVPMEEDTVQYLVDLGVISIIESPEMSSARSRRTLSREMGGGWSDSMMEEINRVLVENELNNASGEHLKFNKVGLDKGTIKQIGRYFSADYILRGRIVEYDLREGQDINPVQQGILPFFFDSSSGLVFGFAKSENYDVWQDVAIGGAIGLAAGSTANTPFNSPSKSSAVVGSHPRDMRVVTDTSGGYSSSAGLNAATWGAVGAGVAYLASEGGYVPKAVVQLSVALQDAKTGRVVWANRVEKEVEPKSVWSDPTDRKNIDLAVEEATKDIAKDLIAALNYVETDGYAAQPQTTQISDNNAVKPTMNNSAPVREDDDIIIIEESEPENMGS
jgi:TolB-like protein